MHTSLKTTIITLTTAAVAIAATACAQEPIVFPTPLPTATPIVLPSPLPTATPVSITFPTPLPTATPITVPPPLPTATPVTFPTPAPTATPAPFPTPLPTATPVVIRYPTPRPTTTPVPTATPTILRYPTPLPTATPTVLEPYVPWAGLHEAVSNGVLPVVGDSAGTAFAYVSPQCKARNLTCLITAAHLHVKDPNLPRIRLGKLDASAPGWRTIGTAVADDLDLALFRTLSSLVPNLRKWELAPDGYLLKAGDPIRGVVIEYVVNEEGLEDIRPYVIDGVVAHVEADSRAFSFTAPVVEGNSGGIILNQDLQVVGMVVQGQEEVRRTTPRAYQFRLPVPGRSRALHINAIRAQLREWEALGP